MRAGLSACLLFCLSMKVAAAGEIKVTHVSSELMENYYYLNAQIDFDFNDDVLGALNHGVELNIDIIIEVKIKRRWLWDKLYKQDVIQFKLNYHPLSSLYVVTRLDNSERRQFNSLNDALQHLGGVNRYFLLNNDNVKAGHRLTGLLKAKLNVDDLPTALKPITFISSQWQLDSQWYQWNIN